MDLRQCISRLCKSLRRSRQDWKCSSIFSSEGDLWRARSNKRAKKFWQMRFTDWFWKVYRKTFPVNQLASCARNKMAIFKIERQRQWLTLNHSAIRQTVNTTLSSKQRIGLQAAPRNFNVLLNKNGRGWFTNDVFISILFTLSSRLSFNCTLDYVKAIPKPIQISHG